MNRHYLSAVVAVAAALLLRYLLNPLLGQQGPYLILTLPIVVVAVYGGMGPALMATALGTSAGTYLFIDRGAGMREVLQPENVTRLLLFVAIGLAIGLLGEQLRRSRAALAEKLQQLNTADRAKDRAIAILGHEIRNPLSAIQSAQTVLQLAPHDEQKVAWAGDVIGRQVAQLTHMADDLLDLAALTRDGPPRKTPVDLLAVLRQAIEQTEPLFHKKGHRLHSDVGDSPVVVSGDHQRLVQVFANLLINAAKYTDPEGEIRVSVQPRESQRVAVVVSDNGVGLPTGAVEDLFEPFVQAPGAASNAEGGLGLGLAIVRKIVIAHGGTVRAESAGLCLGSNFTVVLPLA